MWFYRHFIGNATNIKTEVIENRTPKKSVDISKDREGDIHK